MSLAIWDTHPQMVTNPSTNPAVHGQQLQLNSLSVDHKYDAQTNKYTTKPNMAHLESISFAGHKGIETSSNESYQDF